MIIFYLDGEEQLLGLDPSYIEELGFILFSFCLLLQNQTLTTSWRNKNTLALKNMFSQKVFKQLEENIELIENISKCRTFYNLFICPKKNFYCRIDTVIMFLEYNLKTFVYLKHFRFYIH